MIVDKLKNHQNLSPNEKIAADYILEKIDFLSSLSIQEISSQTYTSPATVVRLAKKLGFDGWPALRDALTAELQYSKTDVDINPNIPFTSQDSLHDIANNLLSLQTNAMEKTNQLIDFDHLTKIVEQLRNANRIYVFAMANTAAVVHDFKYKMRFLFKEVIIINNRDDFGYTFQMLKENDCCIFISYSGKSFFDMNIQNLIFACICPTISITSYSDNPLTKVTNHHLYLYEMEDKSQNIGHFVSNTSIHYVLDLLYACLFQNNYEESMSLRKSYVQHTDHK